MGPSHWLPSSPPPPPPLFQRFPVAFVFHELFVSVVCCNFWISVASVVASWLVQVFSFSVFSVHLSFPVTFCVWLYSLGLCLSFQFVCYKEEEEEDKKNEPYSVVMNFLRCRLSFSLLRSSLLCLRGSRSNRSLNTTLLSQDSLSLVASEGRLNWMITCSWHVPSLFACLSESICLIDLWIF